MSTVFELILINLVILFTGISIGMNYNKDNIKKVRGFLLRDFENNWIFRTYDKNKKHIDYHFKNDAIEIDIIDSDVVFYNKENENYIDYNNEILGKCKNVM